MESINIKGFSLVEVLRETSTSKTLIAKQESLDRSVAICILNPELASDPLAANTFIEVAKATARLKHPHIAQLYDIVTNEGEPPYTVTEHVEGPNLEQRIRSEKCIPPKHAAEMAVAVASGLQHAWKSAHLIHRNIKPQEIYFGEDGTVKIADFGRAMIASKPETFEHETGMIVGTPNYLSPEQAKSSHNLDTRSDMYALGATLYHAVTGVVPFEDLKPIEVLQQQFSGRLAHPKAIIPSLPKGLCLIISRLMMKTPYDRPESWGHVLEDLERVISGRSLLRSTKTTGGISTIRPFSPPSEKPKTPANEQEEPEATPTEKGSPFRLIFWLVFCVWLGFLGYWRWNNPETRLGDHIPGLQPEKAEALETASNPTPPDAGEVHPSPPHNDADQHPDNGVTPTTHPTFPLEISRKIKTALTANNVDEAFTLITQSMSTATDVEKANAIRQTVKALREIDTLVGKSILDAGNEPITINYKGREQTIIPKFFVDGRINAEWVGHDGRRVNFNVKDLAPDEKLRWLPRPEKATHYAMQATLALQAGNEPLLSKALSNSGPFAELLTD